MVQQSYVSQQQAEHSSSAGRVPEGHQQTVSDEIDLREVFGVLKARWKVIALSVFAFTLIAGIYAFSAPKKFHADTQIAPLDNSKSGGGMAAALSGQLGGLAGLAGLSVNGGSEKDVSIATLQSRALIYELIKDENLLPVLFKDQWDEEKNSWETSDPKKIPTLLDGCDLFQKKILKVNEDKKSGLVTLAIEWTSPELTAHWANSLVSRANKLLQQKALNQSEHHLAYLQEQLQQTSLVEVRQSIFTLVENELKNVMLAKGNDQYAFKVIDPAVVPEKKIWPKRALILTLGFVAGLMLSSIAVLAHHSLVVANKVSANPAT